MSSRPTKNTNNNWKKSAKVSKKKSPLREPSVEAESESERNQIAKGLSDLIDKSDEANIENGLTNSQNDVEVIGTVENEP